MHHFRHWARQGVVLNCCQAVAPDYTLAVIKTREHSFVFDLIEGVSFEVGCIV